MGVGTGLQDLSCSRQGSGVRGQGAGSDQAEEDAGVAVDGGHSPGGARQVEPGTHQ